MSPIVAIPPLGLEGELTVPSHCRAIVLFAHGSGSSRHSPRNRYVAEILQQHCLGTLLLDLLTEEEDTDYSTRFDIPLLAERLVTATAWLRAHDETRHLPIGYFGASTGAAAALVASVQAAPIYAIVSRGGRPDLAGPFLSLVSAPTLLIVGELDEEVLELNLRAREQMENCVSDLRIVPGATHLFEEPGTLTTAANFAGGWFELQLPHSGGAL